MTLHVTEREAARLQLPAGKAAPRKRQKRDTIAEDSFAFQCRAMRLPTVEREYRFAKSLDRQWRADFSFPQYWLLVEIDGGIWIRGAHAHPTDILRNMRKRNDAALLGYSVLAFTPAEVKSGYAVGFTERVLAERGWIRL